MLLEVEYLGSGDGMQELRSVALYHKMKVDELQTFLWERSPTWANNGNSVEEHDLFLTLNGSSSSMSVTQPKLNRGIFKQVCRITAIYSNEYD